MATKKKVTDLQSASSLNDADVIHVVDVSDTSQDPAGSSKKLPLSVLKAFVGSDTGAELDAHIADHNNPHEVTKAQVGLGNADNTSDLNKPISNAAQAALDQKVNTSEKGANNGVATLDAGGKIPASQLPLTVMEYKGNWNATTNIPALADGTGNTGDVYRVNTAGTQNLGSGSISFKIGDFVVYNGSIWEKSINSTDVVSVNGHQGVVSLSTTEIPEGSNLYYTSARFDTAFAAKSTSDLAEGSNLYFTNSRAVSALSGLYEVPLTFSTGLTRTINTVTANLSVGVSGGQSVIGGTASGNSLTLSSTSNATKGKIVFGTSVYDEANNRLGIGIAFPQSTISISTVITNTGTASQSGNTITGSGTSFSASMVGSQFIFADGTSAGTITAFSSTTSITVSVSQTVTPAQGFSINFQGLRGNTNNFSIGSAPSGGVGPFFKVGGPTTSNTWAITGSNLSTTITAGFDSGTNTDGDGSLASYTNTTNSGASGAVRFIRSNPSGAVASGWVLGEIASYGGKTATTFTDKSAAIRFVATETHSSSAAGTNITFSTVGNTTTTLNERMRILQDGNVSIGTTSSLSRLAVLSTAADQMRLLYDTSNNLRFTVSSSGFTTLDSISSNGSAGFNFNILSSTVTGNQTNWYFSNGNGIAGVTSGTSRSMYMVDTFRPTSGTTVYNTFELTPTINQIGGANGITRGIYVNPIFTSVLGNWRGMEINNQNSSLIYSDSDFAGTTNTPTLRIQRTASSGNTKLELMGQGTVLMSLIANTGGEQRIFTAPGGSYLSMYSNGIEAARFDTAQNLGIGVAASISARTHIVSTTEQLRLGYDPANYNSFTTSSGGNLTINSSNASGVFDLRVNGSLAQRFGAGSIGSGNGQQAFSVTGGTANTSIWAYTGGNITASSGTQYGYNLALNVNQTSTAGYTGLLLNIIETTTGSGAKNIIDLQRGGVSQFSIDRTGAISSAANGIALASTQFQSGKFTYSGLNSFQFLQSSGVSGALGVTLLDLSTINITATSGAGAYVGVTGTFAPTSGSAALTAFLVKPTINQTGGASGATWGIKIDPTLTAAANFTALEIVNGKSVFGGVVNLKNYTVATLPAGTRGDTAYVTDALAPTFLGIIVGGGTVACPVFYDGANWVAK